MSTAPPCSRESRLDEGRHLLHDDALHGGLLAPVIVARLEHGLLAPHQLLQSVGAKSGAVVLEELHRPRGRPCRRPRRVWRRRRSGWPRLHCCLSRIGFGLSRLNEMAWSPSILIWSGVCKPSTAVWNRPWPLRLNLRPQVHFTSFAVNGLPQFDFTPSRSLKVALRPSGAQLPALGELALEREAVRLVGMHARVLAQDVRRIGVGHLLVAEHVFVECRRGCRSSPD